MEEISFGRNKSAETVEKETEYLILEEKALAGFGETEKRGKIGKLFCYITAAIALWGAKDALAGEVVKDADDLARKSGVVLNVGKESFSEVAKLKVFFEEVGGLDENLPENEIENEIIAAIARLDLLLSSNKKLSNDEKIRTAVDVLRENQTDFKAELGVKKAEFLERILSNRISIQ